MTPVLLTTIHDPDGKMIDTTCAVLGELASLYAGVVVEMTNNTHDRMKRLLHNVAHIHCNPPGDIARARRELIHNGLGLYRLSCFHFADFDRLLHWWTHYPDELSRVVAEIPYHKFIIFGRTKRAFQTHPFWQRETERVVNLAYGHAGRMDVLTASRGISNEAARLIRDKSKAIGPAGVDVEWPTIVGKYYLVMYVPVEGLEYEADTFGMRRATIDEARLRFRNLRQGLTVIWSQNGH